MSVKKHKDGYLVRRKVHGKDIRLIKSTRREADIADASLMKQQYSNEPRIDNTMSIVECLERYHRHLLERCKAGKRSPNTIDRWLTSTSHWAKHFSRKRLHSVSELSFSVVEDFCSWRRRQFKDKKKTKPISEQTIYNDFRALHAALSWAAVWKLIASNPIAGYPFDHRDIVHVVPDLPTPEEIQAIFDLLPDDDTRKAYYFILSTGCRYGDMASLEAEDISPTGRIHFWRAVKGRVKYERYAPLPELPFALPADGRVFIRDGRPWIEKTILDRIQKAALAAGAPKINIHSLRRAHATYELALGRKTVGQLMESCGWRSFGVAERYIQAAKNYDIEEYLPVWKGKIEDDIGKKHPASSHQGRQNSGSRPQVIKFKKVI